MHGGGRGGRGSGGLLGSREAVKKKLQPQPQQQQQQQGQQLLGAGGTKALANQASTHYQTALFLKTGAGDSDAAAAEGAAKAGCATPPSAGRNSSASSGGGRGTNSGSSGSRGSSSSSTANDEDGDRANWPLSVKLGKALWLCGQEDAAITLWQTILGADEGYPDALLHFGVAATRRGKVEEGMQILLKALLLRTEHRETRKALTEVVVTHGVERLLRQFTPGPAAASALAFVATLIKDFGACRESADIYAATVDMHPTNSYVLNFIHTLELEARYDECVSRLRLFFAAHPERSVGGVVCCADFAAVLDHLGDGGAPGHSAVSIDPWRHDANQTSSSSSSGSSSSTGTTAAAAAAAATVIPQFAGWTVRWIPGDGAHAVVERTGLGLEPGVDDESKTAHRYGSGGSNAATSSSGGSIIRARSSPLSCSYSKDELDLLAVFFALVKILYNMGVLQLIPPLIRLLEPARRGQNIHSTLVRNEHAYYCCIAQTLAVQPPAQLVAGGAAAGGGGGGGGGGGRRRLSA
eukprot:g931.t1